MHPLLFAQLAQETEKEKDNAELEHFRSLHKYDNRLTDDEMEYWETYYLVRELERNQTWDKSLKLKNELIENKNLLELYNKKEDETPIERINNEDSTTI